MEITGRWLRALNSATCFEMLAISADESVISARAPPRRLSQGDLELGGISKLENLNLHGERLCRGLDRADLGRAARRVPEDGDLPSPGRDLSEEIQQFPRQSRLIHEQARDVAARSRVAPNESSLDGIDFEVDSHDGDRLRGADGGADGRDAGGEEDIDFEADEIGRERRHRLRLLSAKSIL
jgi:hypothetical protein